ncbi:MAG: acyltransferase domain-containing protein [Candidatus Heimdallarchaeota archaeon]|nr:acyltransferase domain-containing protein [Candidatus Heimdallarchaeota archaeon]
MKTRRQIINEIDPTRIIWGYSPKGISNPQLSIELSQKGGVGLVDLEGLDEQSISNILETCSKKIPKENIWGIKLSDVSQIEVVNKMEHIPILIIPKKIEIEQLMSLTCEYDWLIAEVRNVSEAQEKTEWADFFLVKGFESGGSIGEKSSFILIQEFNEVGYPFIIQGGIGVYNIISALIGGALGVVLEEQLLLLPECPLTAETKKYLASLDENDTYIIGESFDRKFRITGKIANKWIREFKTIEKTTTQDNFQELSQKIEEVSRTSAFLADQEIKNSFIPLGVGLRFASFISDKFGDLTAFLSGVKQIIRTQMVNLSDNWSFSEENEFAISLGIKLPIIQGPMANITDSADFALQVFNEGALPVLAFGGLLKEEAEILFKELHEKYPKSAPYAGGIIGLEVMKERRDAHISLIQENKTPLCLVAAGSIQLASRIQKAGTKVILHTPALSFFKDAIQNKIEYLILEGSECGGHIGILTSFTLWESIIQYVEREKSNISDKLKIVFAGGISDDRSTAMLAGMVSNHLDYISPGIQMGTAYLLTEEIVKCKALTSIYQEHVLNSSETKVIGTTVNTRARAIPSEFVETTLKLELERIREGMSIHDRKKVYEKDNLGALRIAGKAEIWNEKYKPGGASTQFVSASKKIQESKGCYMAGELIGLKRNILRIRDLHHDVVKSGKIYATQQIAELEKIHLDAVTSDVQIKESISLPIKNRVAIVGMGCILPDAENISQFWTNIIQKKYSITEISDERWKASLHFDEDKTAENKTYSKIGSFIKEYNFDSIRYRIPPKIAERMDDVQKWSLDSARQALEDAGIPTDGKLKLPIAVIVGNSLGGEIQRNTNKLFFVPEFIEEIKTNIVFQELTEEKQKNMINHLLDFSKKHYPSITEDSMPGELSNIIAGRIANVFNLIGKSMTTDAACASSVAAIDTAVNSLLSGEINVVLTGGADRSMDVATYVKFSKIGALSGTGTRPFDENADGFVMGEGAGFIVLKRLEDALTDGNKIYAVISSIGSSSDGKGKGITAPNPEGQKRAIERAMEKAQIDTNEVDYIEAHGTSTVVGDAVELQVLEGIFKDRTSDHKLNVSSIKSQIGHLKSASGIASIIKASLALYHKKLPPSINVEKPNPNIDWNNSKLRINTEVSEWNSSSSVVARVGVSAFGFGGANYHAILEEFNPAKIQYEKKPQLSISENIQEEIDQSQISLQSIKPKLCYMFTGQGSQYLGMAKQLYENSEIVKEYFEKAEQIWYGYYTYSFKEIVFGSEKLSNESNKKRLTDTKFTQPAIFVVDVSIASLLAEEGIEPNIVAGHSLGEYAALVIAGALSFEDGLKAVIERGRSMSRAGNSVPGAMAAILAPINQVHEIVKGVKNCYVTVANYNSKNQTVVSGEIEGIEQVLEISKQKGITAKRLNVSTAFHSKIVKSVEEEMEKVLSRIEFNEPKIPVYSNATGKVYPPKPEEIRKLLVQQISSSVLWVNEIQNIYNAGARFFVEIGPKKALFSFVKDILQDKTDISAFTTLIPKQNEIETVETTVNQIRQFIDPASLADLDPQFKKIKTEQEIVFPGEIAVSPDSDFQSFVRNNSNYLENILKSGYELYSNYLGENEEVKSAKSVAPVRHQLIGVTGVGVGFPGKSRNVFDDGNIDAILSGENLIDSIREDIRQNMLDKNINRLVKSPEGIASFEEIDELTKVINLAGQLGNFDPVGDFKLDEKLLSSLDITFQLAICAGLEALNNAGIPLVKSSFRTSTGKVLEGDWALPEPLQDETGIIFASAFPGYDNLVKEIQEQTNSDNDKKFSRNFLFKILSMGHSQFAQLIKAKGPNTQINAACASTTQAIGIAEDWIRIGRCNRVIVIAADDASSENLLPWLGSGFLAAGGVTTEEKVENAALPFGKNRHGLIIGSAAAALILENEDAYNMRGVKPIVDLIGSSFLNSGFHGSRLDVQHISKAFQNFVEKIEEQYHIPRKSLAEEGMFVSHETYTPARGGSAESEIEALKSVFGKDACKITIVNTKGFTGHAMGAGIEECVAIKSMEKGRIPPIANIAKIDPLFSELRFSEGENRRVKYAIRLAAGFGSQVAFTAFRLNTFEDRYDLILHDEWLSGLGGNMGRTFLDGRVLKMTTKSKLEISTSAKSKSHDIAKNLVSTDILPSVISIISEITGYETNLIEAEMHLEEDLGIDTVKQAEIFGILREKWDLELDDTVSLAEFTTPQKIAIYVQSNVGEIGSSEPVDPPNLMETSEDLNRKIREVISETTGYEQNLIEFDMDLEEDLGIDTIKQAEIFGDIREIYDLPIDESISLAEFRTINDIAGYVHRYVGDVPSITSEISESVEELPRTEKEQDLEDTVRIDKLITVPIPLDKSKADKVNLTELSTLVIDINSSLGEELASSLKERKANYKICKLLKEKSELEETNFDLFILLLPDPISEPGLIDQEIYTKIFTLFQSLELNSNQRIIAVSKENYFGLRKDANPISGGISGFVKTIGIEFEMAYKHIYSENIKYIIQELEYWDTNVEIAYEKKNRFTLANLDISDYLTQSSKIHVKGSDLLLVTGGGRGITFKCLEALCTIVKSKVAIFGIEDISNVDSEALLLSPEELEERKQKLIEELKETEEKVTPVLIDRHWNNFLFGLEVVRNLEILRKKKIKVEYRRVDVTNTKDVEEAIRDIESHFETSVSHIIHGAGLEESKSFKKKKLDFSSLIVSVKVEGIWNILNSIDTKKLKRVVCFTSIAGRYGNRGQVDYSFANGYLSRLCWKLNQQGVSAVACDWSAWGGVGMATRGSIMDILTSQGINPIPVQEGTESFVKLFLNTIGDEVIVSCGLGPFEKMSEIKSKIKESKYPLIESLEYYDSTFFTRKAINSENDLYLNDHQIQQTPIFPGVMGLEFFAETFEILSSQKPVSFSNVEFNTALKIQQSQTKEIYVEYKSDIGKMKLKSDFIAKIDPSKRREIEHFTINVDVSTRRKKAKKSENEIRESDINLLSKEDIYSFFFHGESFQVLEKLINLDGKKAISQIEIPDKNLFSDKRSKTTLNPLAIEAALQTAGLYDYIVNSKTSLPSKIETITFYNNKKPKYIVSIFTGINTTHSTFDVEILDEKRNIIAKLDGLGMIHTQLNFKEESEIKDKLQETFRYWEITNSLNHDNFRIIPVRIVASLLSTNPKTVLSSLTSKEKERFDTFKNEKRRIEYLSGVIASKELYSLLVNKENKPKEIEIRKEKKGRPYFYDLKKDEPSNLHLSITHSGEFAIAAVGQSPIGIDIEKIEERSESFYKEAFTEKERNEISSDAEKGTIYWTIKEAITKALGEGLHLNLHDIEISENQEKSSYTIGFSSKVADTVPYDADSFEITNKSFQNYTITYCEIRQEDKK